MQLKDIEKEILSEVVFHYIQNLEPIGSVQLKELASIDLSSATIRNYFGKLVTEGFLTQLHASSGRIPTQRALQDYWKASLAFDTPLSIDGSKLDDASRIFGLYAMLQNRSSNRLLEIEKSAGDLLTLIFEDGVVATRSTALVERLLREFLGYDLADLIAIAKLNRVDILTRSLWQLRKSTIARFNLKALIDFVAEYELDEGYFDDFYDGFLVENLRAGIYYEPVVPEGYALVAQNARIDHKPALIALLGSTSSNFGAFINYITKGE